MSSLPFGISMSVLCIHLTCGSAQQFCTTKKANFLVPWSVTLYPGDPGYRMHSTSQYQQCWDDWYLMKEMQSDWLALFI